MAKFLTQVSHLTFLIFICGMAGNAFAIDFKQCFKGIRANHTSEAGGVDLRGNPVAIPDAVGVTYERCVEWCGPASENFDFTLFSRRFTAWLLPWLALISQLPFNGSNDTVDDVLSVALAVGSPTLAGYSLTLTVLNERWLDRCIKGMKDFGASHRQAHGLDRASRNRLERQKSSVDAALIEVQIVLNRLQTTSLEVCGDNLTLLVKQHLASEGHEPSDGENWWRTMTRELNYPPSGVVSAITGLVWVFTAYVFTVIDAFQSLRVLENTYGPGLGYGRSPVGISDGQGVGSIWLWLLPVVVGWLLISPKYQNGLNHSAFANSKTSFAICAPIAVDGDKGRSAPIFNYARFITWTKHVEHILGEYRVAYEAAMLAAVRPADQDTMGQPIDPKSNPVFHNGGPSESELEEGQQGNDTGNSYQLRTLGPMSTGKNMSLPNTPGPYSQPQYVRRFLLAFVAGAMLQWGTAGGAIIIHWFTPTIGLGCRSLNWLLYAGVSTLVWILLVLSSFLDHCAQYWVSTPLRYLGHTLAASNAIGILVTCLVQFGNFYDRCYCNSVVIQLKAKAYQVFWVRDLGDIGNPWIGGVALGVGSAALFIALNCILRPNQKIGS